MTRIISLTLAPPTFTTKEVAAAAVALIDRSHNLSKVTRWGRDSVRIPSRPAWLQTVCLSRYTVLPTAYGMLSWASERCSERRRITGDLAGGSALAGCGTPESGVRAVAESKQKKEVWGGGVMSQPRQRSI